MLNNFTANTILLGVREKLLHKMVLKKCNLYHVLNFKFFRNYYNRGCIFFYFKVNDPCYENGASLCKTATEICNVTTSKCECAAGFTLIDGICGCRSISIHVIGDLRFAVTPMNIPFQISVNTPCFQHDCPVHAMCVEVNETSFTCHCNGNGGYEKTGGDDDRTIVCTGTCAFLNNNEVARTYIGLPTSKKECTAKM